MSDSAPPLEDLKPPVGCQIDVMDGDRRFCVESYDDVIARHREASPDEFIEFQVLSHHVLGDEVVRWSVEKRLINRILEVTDALLEKWRKVEEQNEAYRKSMQESGQEASSLQVIRLPGFPPFRIE